MTRLFVALDLPDDVKSALLRLGTGVPGAHWQTTDQLHLTLRFVGDVDGPLATDIATALDAIDMAGFEVEITGVGLFGTLKRSHTLWAGIRANPALNHLQEKIESTLVRTGLKPETRKFHPHVTLARLGNPERHRLQDFLQAHAGLRLPAFPVDHFTLFSSFVTNKGSIYAAEARYPLSGAA
jgi:RNA 2',3'-cyclic 3'-phosphodiesterase